MVREFIRGFNACSAGSRKSESSYKLRSLVTICMRPYMYTDPHFQALRRQCYKAIEGGEALV